MRVLIYRASVVTSCIRATHVDVKGALLVGMDGTVTANTLLLGLANFLDLAVELEHALLVVHLAGDCQYNRQEGRLTRCGS